MGATFIKYSNLSWKSFDNHCVAISEISKMKRPAFILTCILVTFVLAPKASAWETEDGRLIAHGMYSIEVYYDHVYGNVIESSKDIHYSKKDNYHYTENLNIELTGKVKEDMTLDFAFTGSHSTDKNVQLHRYELEKLYIGLTGKNCELAFGDLTELFSYYTFSRDFFGFRANCKVEDLLTFKVLAGRNKMRKDDQFEQVFGGGMVTFTPHPNYELTTSYVHAEITDLYPNATIPNYRNDVWSIGSKMWFFDRRALLTGEGAISKYVTDRRDPQPETLDGKALWAALILKPLREELNLALAYEYIEPNFKAIMGEHSTDRETYLLYVDYKPSEMFHFIYHYQFYRDHLTNKSTAKYRTNTHDAETEITLKPFMYDDENYFKNLNFIFHFGYVYEKSEDIPESVNNQNIHINLTAANSMEKYWGKVGWNLCFDLSYDIDHTLHADDTLTTDIGVEFNCSTNTYGLDFGLGMNFSVGFQDRYIKYPRETLTRMTSTAGVDFTVINKRWLPYETTLNISYFGTWIDKELGDDTIFHETDISLTQVLIKKNDVISSIIFSYSNNDFRSQDPLYRYGEDEYKVTFKLEF